MTSIQIIGSIMAATGEKVPVVATKNGCTIMTFYRVINGVSTNQGIREIISKLIDKPINEIWPEEPHGDSQ